MGAAAIAVAGGSLAYHRVLSGLVSSRVEGMLAAHGFPGAHVGAAHLELHHLRLDDVTLGDGLAIGAVEIDAGLSLLWRTRISQITLRDATLSARLIDRLAPSAAGPASGLPFDVVRIENGTVVLGDVRAAVSGTISPQVGAISVDLEATSERVALATIELRDVRASLRSAGAGRFRACITGRVTGEVDATASACGMVPAAPGELRVLRAVDTTFAVAAPGWQLRGTGTVGWASTPEITGGHVTLTAPVLRAASLTLQGARFSMDLAGSLAGRELRLDVTGVAEADRVELRGRSVAAISRTVRLPLAGRAVIAGSAVRVTPRQAVLATARDASIRVGDVAVELASPSLAAYPAGQTLVVDLTGEDPRPAGRAAGGPTPRDPAAPIDRAIAAPRTLRWSASAARLGAARFLAPSGTLLDGRTLRWRAAEAQWGGARFRAPSGTLLAGRTLSWRAAEARWGGARFQAPSGVFELDASRESSAAWGAVTGPGPLALGAGEVGFHRAAGRLMIDHGHAFALGGELAVEHFAGPVAGDPDPTALIVHARGLELHRVLAAFAHGHADGDGVLDGELALRIGDAGTTVERGALHARATGDLRLSDAAWRAGAVASAAGFALHQRIAAALCDFEYSRLAAVLHTMGADPELQITTRGRGKRVAQDLDLVINVRGVRDAARHLPFAQSPRSQP